MQQSVEAPDRTFTVEEFLAEYEGREGQYELVDGKVLHMSPEGLLHAKVKSWIAAALVAALREADAEMFVATDGVALRTARGTARVPDLVVGWDNMESDSALAVASPIVVVEILSPSTAATDQVAKLAEYFSIPTVRDYLIVDADARLATHHLRLDDGRIVSKVVGESRLLLAAGLTVDVAAFWPPRRA